MKQQTYARVYRFHDAVAFSTDNSAEAAYLSVELAREVAVLLIKYADDVDDCAFSNSALGTRYAGRRDVDDAREIAAADAKLCAYPAGAVHATECYQQGGHLYGHKP